MQHAQSSPILSSSQRLLVIAPHPDDESIGAGGLLSQVADVGASARVLLLTDGDQNPWPQRVLERRLHLGAHDRQRWATRRRDEMRAALAALGLPATTLTCLGWPDLGVTSRLMDDTRASVGALAAVLDAYRPDVLVYPALADAHPDHSAAHVLMHLALQRATAPAPRVLTYLVHGAEADAATLTLALDDEHVQRKRQAILAHASQVALSRGRLLRHAASAERFGTALAAGSSEAIADGWPWQGRLPLTGCELLLVAGERAWSEPVPAIRKHWPGPGVDPAVPVFAKLRNRWPSPWIFDHYGWRLLRKAT